MVNTRQIQPLTFWSKDGNKTANLILLYNFHGYNFDGTDSYVSYKLGYTEEAGEGQEMFYSLFEGSVEVTNAVVQSWGQDDEPIFNYVITKLNLTRDE